MSVQSPPVEVTTPPLPRPKRFAELLRNYGLTGPLLVISGVLVLLPVTVVLLSSFVTGSLRPGDTLGSFTFDHYIEIFTDPKYLAALGNTAIIAIGGTVLAVVTGGLLAWLVARTNVRWRGFVEICGIAPIFVSPLIAAIAYSLLGSPRSGYINLMLQGIGIPAEFSIYSLPGIIFVLGLHYVPYSFMFLSSALRNMNPELEDAGIQHGGSRFKVMRSISIPLVTPAIVASSLLTFVLSAENFPIVQILGAQQGIPTIPAEIYAHTRGANLNFGTASSLGMTLVVFVAILVYVQGRIVGRREFTTVTGKGMRSRTIDLGPWRWLGLAFALLVILFSVILPLFALLISSLHAHSYIPDAAAMFQSLTLNNFAVTWNDSAFQTGITNTVILAFGTVLLGGALYMAMAYVAERTTGKGRRLLRYVSSMPLALPAPIVGIGILYVWVNVPIVYGTMLVLIMAFATRFMTQGFQGFSASLVQVSKDLEEASFVSGASRFTTLRRITVPLIRNGVLSTAILVFVLSSRELTTALFLYSTNNRPLSIVLYNQWETGSWTSVATMSLFYSALLLILTVISQLVGRIGSHDKNDRLPTRPKRAPRIPA